MKLGSLLAQPHSKSDVEITRVVDDTRVLQRGDWLVWDAQINPALTDKVLADAQVKGAAGVISNVDAADVVVAQPGELLARYAAATWPRQPATMLGITGTSGKTSVAWFAQQLDVGAPHTPRSPLLANETFAAQSELRRPSRIASMGTLGVVRGSKVLEYTGYTSPTALQLHPRLQALADDGVDTCVVEVSSHASALRRVEGVRWSAIGWGNFSQDHLDFHGSMQDYFAAKLRYFGEVLPEGKTAVINMNHEALWVAASVAKQRGCPVLSVGTCNAELVVEVIENNARGLVVDLKFDLAPVRVKLPLVGAFQAENVAMALGLLVAGGHAWKEVSAAAGRLTGVPGRMEVVPARDDQPVVVVDYAHKPDALEKALLALRPQTRGKLWVVFGCGGNRDAGKRAVMGEIAARLADCVVVTDDNPRKEDAASIRAAVLGGAKVAGWLREEGDRRKAIALAVEAARAEDVVLVAGKGHEDGQIVGDVVLPFDDRSVVREVLG